jgi:hypothetical protein
LSSRRELWKLACPWPPNWQLASLGAFGRHRSCRRTGLARLSVWPLGSVRNFFPTLGWLFPRIASRTDVNSAAWCAFHCSDHFRAVRHLMNRGAYSICQFGSWVRSVVFGVEDSGKPISHAEPQSRKNNQRHGPRFGATARPPALCPQTASRAGPSVSRRGSRLSPVGQLSGKVGRPRHNLSGGCAR